MGNNNGAWFHWKTLIFHCLWTVKKLLPLFKFLSVTASSTCVIGTSDTGTGTQTATWIWRWARAVAYLCGKSGNSYHPHSSSTLISPAVFPTRVLCSRPTHQNGVQKKQDSDGDWRTSHIYIHHFAPGFRVASLPFLPLTNVTALLSKPVEPLYLDFCLFFFCFRELQGRINMGTGTDPPTSLA